MAALSLIVMKERNRKGIPAHALRRMDEQHSRILKLLQRLSESPETSVRSEVISETLSELTQLASDHFRDEEEFLQDHGYPDLAQHMEEHKAYRLKVVSLCFGVMDGRESVPEELFEFLQGWWRDHHDGADQRAEAFLRGLYR